MSEEKILSVEEMQQIELQLRLRKRYGCRLCVCGRFIDLDKRGRFVKHFKSLISDEFCKMSERSYVNERR